MKRKGRGGRAGQKTSLPTPRVRPSLRSAGHFSSWRGFVRLVMGREGLVTGESLRAIVGCAPSTISRWIRGFRFPRGARLARMAAALRVDPNALLILGIAADLDRLFRTGAGSLEELHQAAVELIESHADLRRVDDE